MTFQLYVPWSGIYSTNDTKTFPKETHVPQQTTQSATDLRVDPSNETIRLGPLAVRFLLTGDESNGSVAVFEAYVPSGQRLTAPATSSSSRRARFE